MLPDPTSLILVAYLPAPRDMEIARLLGWYRIPLRTAPKVIQVDYLAFYQAGPFGEEHRWRIETFAALRGAELTARAELLRDEPDHPRAREEYYKMQLGPLERLPQPILARRWRRITFLYTTGDLLLRARTVNDLWWCAPRSARCCGRPSASAPSTPGPTPPKNCPNCPSIRPSWPCWGA